VTAARDGARYLAVLVLVHGESYVVGSGNAYDASVLAVAGRLVVITLNYRLGILGIDSRRYSFSRLSPRRNFGATKDRFWATVCKTVRPMLSVRCLSVCMSVCNVGAQWPNC